MTSVTENQSPSINIQTTTSSLTFANRWQHFQARFAIRRSKHRVNPGVYSLGRPTEDSPVFVTANYMLSFDALRSALANRDCYILVLDTKGINVWCAAGKGTFGTDELVRQIETTSLKQLVKHRKLILPQLGAPGVAAHEVKKQSGFSVEYGPIRAKDLPEYLRNHHATPEMRRVVFPFKERLVLIPVELVGVLLPLLVVAVILYFIGGFMSSAGAIAAALAGVILFPVLLPWIPTPNFSTKGFLLGFLVVLPFFLNILLGNSGLILWQRAGWAFAYLLALPPVTAYLSLNFTGATTFTSRSGVKREIYTYIPVMAWMFGGGILLSIILTLINVLKG